MVLIREADKAITYNTQSVTYAKNVVPSYQENKIIEVNDKKEFSNTRNNTEYNVTVTGILSTN